MRLSFARWIVPVSCIALLVPVLASARVSDATTGLSASGRAAGLSSACSGSATQCVATLLGRVLNILFGFLGIILLGYVLYGGFVWMTAGGNGKEVGQAQDIIRNAVIGVIIIACSFAISNFVLGRLGEIAGVGGNSSTAGTTDGSGAGGAGNPTVDQLMDGATRPCCYGNPYPMGSCVADCQRNPTAFGITGPGSENACIVPCGSRICTGGTPSDPRPVPGQQQCRPGNPTERPITGGGTPSTTPTYTRAEFCRSLDVEAGTLNPTRDACRICANGCLADICLSRLPAGMPGRVAPLIDTQTQATAVRTRCENEVCTVQCRVGY